MCVHTSPQASDLCNCANRSASAKLFPCVKTQALVPTPDMEVRTTNEVRGAQGSHFNLKEWLKV